MKYHYAYKTSDGCRHEDALEAPSRDAAFAELRRRGIKAIKVVAADGSRANGAPAGARRGARAALFAALGVLLGALLVGVSVRARRESVAPAPEAPRVTRYSAQPLPRQMIPGDRDRLAKGRTDAFASDAERYLACFAEPGRLVEPPARPSDEAFAEALKTSVMIREDDFTEIVDLKRMVSALKRELADYLAAGGEVGGYLAALEARQKEEAAHRARAAKRLDELMAAPDGIEGAYEYWLKANANLHAMGIYPLEMPGGLRGRNVPFAWE